jgi:hypothetical protein
MSSNQIPCSACPKCQTKMMLAHVTRGPIGFEHQSFECRACDYAENVVVALDPMNPNKLGWLVGELGAPPIQVPHTNPVTYIVREGRMIPHPAR